MRKNVQTLLIISLIVFSDIVSGKGNKTKKFKSSQLKTNNNALKDKYEKERVKRSLTSNDDSDSPFYANRGKKQNNEELIDSRNDNGLVYGQKVVKSDDKIIKNEPFWANRGRRGYSGENNYDDEYPDLSPKYCDGCPKNPGSKIVLPFKESRTTRNSIDLEDISEPFWGNRGRREENEPFWGNRGRRNENEPFWGNRGRREEDPFWDNRGRRDDSEPFWGNRGRRDNSEPFWGNRGRRQENEPFWGNRGRREEAPFWSNRGRRKQDLKDSILSTISKVENDIDNLSRLKRANLKTFWGNRGRDSKMAHIFTEPLRNRLPSTSERIYGKTDELASVLDNQMYVDEPNYILVERTGRSSAEFEDPYYISRGKKYYLGHSLEKAVRDRRGAIEEIVKTMRNDPYYIARGKKDDKVFKNVSSAAGLNEFMKAKDLICTTIDFIMANKGNGKVKRQINDNERNRRTILEKLAAQLQADPYFVSRGKKSDVTGEKNDYEQFLRSVAEKCN